MANSLLGKKIIVTGGSGGIGSAIVERFVAEGCQVVFTYHTNLQAAEQLVDDLSNKYGSGKVLAVKFDLRQAEDRQRLLWESIQFMGDVDHLVNNAGISMTKDFFDLTEQDFQNIADVNLKGTFFLTQVISQYMQQSQMQLKARNLTLSDKSITLIISISGKIPTPGILPYEITKAALEHLAKALVIEPQLQKNGIRVNSVAPGLIPTPMTGFPKQPKGQPVIVPFFWDVPKRAIPAARLGKPKEIADAVFFVAKNKFANGQTLTVDGGRSVNYYGAAINPEQDTADTQQLRAKL